MDGDNKIILDLVSSKLDTVNVTIGGLKDQMSNLSIDVKHKISNMEMMIQATERKFIPAAEIKMMHDANLKAHMDIKDYITGEVRSVSDKIDDRSKRTNDRIDSLMEAKARWFKPIVDNAMHLVIIIVVGVFGLIWGGHLLPILHP